MARYEIIAQGICPGPNDRLHWQQRRRLEAPIKEELGWAAKAIAPKEPLQRAKVTVTLIKPRLFDADNAYGCAKGAIDAIKGILISDDSVKYIELIVNQERGKGRHTRIVVEDIE